MKAPLKKQLISEKWQAKLRGLGHYSVIFFLIFVALIYGFVLLHINNLNTAQPSDQAVSSQVKAAHVPHIDQSVVKQIQSLQDNSVSVQSLFDQARNNPFQ
jgi:hypothetical protein